MPTTDNRKVLFLWIPKTAGSSIYKLLKNSGCRKYISYQDCKQFDNSGIVTFGHIDFNFLLKKKIVSLDYFTTAHKICVVRNPWDRMVSLYFYTRMHERMSFDAFVHLIYRKTKLKNQPFIKNFFAVGRSLVPTLVYKALLKISPRLTHVLPLPDVGRYNVIELSQCNEQLAWITNRDGTIQVDTICRFENLNQDLNSFCDRFGIQGKLPFENTTKHKNYRSYYTDELRLLVGKIYRNDIERFNYEF